MNLNLEFAEPVQWNQENEYSINDVVFNGSESFTAIDYVPSGTELSNSAYWKRTGKFIHRNQLADDVLSEIDGSVKAFDTVADMQAATLEAGNICHTNGFHAGGDGGAAFYEITATGTANGMDVLACGDVFANLVITESYVTPEQFGAWGDGVHDDSSYIQRSITISDEIKLLTKIYLLQNTIEISINGKYIEGSNIVGLSSIQGKSKTVILVDHEGIGINLKHTTSGQVFQGCYFKGFAIEASENVQNSSSAIGLQVYNWNHCTFENLGIYNFQNSAGVRLRAGGQYSSFIDCKFADCKYCIYEKSESSDPSQFYAGVHVINCMFDGNRNGSDNNSNPRDGAYGIYCTSAGGWKIDLCRFQGFETCVRLGTGACNVVSNSRFEMFNYGIVVNGSFTTIEAGNSFNRYLGTTTPKIAVQISENATRTVIEPQAITSCDPVAIRDLSSSSTERNDLCRGFVNVGTISDTTNIYLPKPPYAALISNVRLIAATGDVIGNTVTDYWQLTASSWSSYWNSVNKNWVGNEGVTAVPKINASGSGTATTQPICITLTKHNNPDAIPNLLIEFEYERY